MPTPSAQITLYLSARDKIIALPSGTGRRWAETALNLAGITENHDQIHTLPLDDQAKARQALTHLHQAALDCQVTITTHPRPYLGDIAETIAMELPGHWQADTTDLRHQQDQDHLRDFLWESGVLYGLLESARLGFAAILRDGGGTELLLVERPSDGSYVAGAMMVSPDHLQVTGPAPRSVIASDARLMTRFIQTRLLPDYERALHLSRLHEMERDLRWAQGTHEPGTYDPREVEHALYRYRSHAAAVIAMLRDDQPLPADRSLFLERVEDGLSLDEQDTLDPEALANAQAVWQADGEMLLELARAATPPPITPTPAQAPSPGPRAQPLAPTAPPPATGIGTSPRR
ncbi:hypothetical protein [Streptomyces sp. MNP-20]|uniref:hypothetical protein n=1 Tax=Streptomyces sp. MNP-20 TaxID=2721165 RepID=UPI001556C0C5|nr:hypothetical protein [Streptomyces sp. MNP-20]